MERKSKIIQRDDERPAADDATLNPTAETARTTETSTAEVAQNDGADETDNITENPNGRTAFPGLIFLLCVKGFDFQVPDLVQKYQEVISMTGIQLLECQVYFDFFLYIWVPRRLGL